MGPMGTPYLPLEGSSGIPSGAPMAPLDTGMAPSKDASGLAPFNGGRGRAKKHGGFMVSQWWHNEAHLKSKLSANRFNSF